MLKQCIYTPDKTSPSIYQKHANATLENTLKSGEDGNFCLQMLNLSLQIFVKLFINNGGGHWTMLFSGNWWLLKNSSFSRTCSRNWCNIWFIRRIPSSIHCSSNNSFGSGWAWLVVNKEGKLKVTSIANQDTQSQKVKKTNLGLGRLGTCLLREIPQRSSWLYQSFLLSYQLEQSKTRLYAAAK